MSIFIDIIIDAQKKSQPVKKNKTKFTIDDFIIKLNKIFIQM